MINILFVYNKDDNIKRFRVESHGEPIVCSAVSALVITCVNFLSEILNEEIDLKKKDEEYIDCTFLYNISKNAALAVDQMAYGLELIAESYPNDINITMEGEYND